MIPIDYKTTIFLPCYTTKYGIPLRLLQVWGSLQVTHMQFATFSIGDA